MPRNAEESASASEEMSAQAEQMKQFVLELADLVGVASVLEKQTAPSNVVSEPKMVAAYEKRPTSGKISVPPVKRSLGPKQIIPFDNAEVSDF